MQIPGLADDRHDGGLGVDQGFHADIVLGGDVAPTGHAEGDDLGLAQRKVADRPEVGGVLGVGERVSPLDVLDAQLVEPGRDQQLVLEREVHPLTLAAVAQGRVVDRNPRRRAHWLRSARFLGSFASNGPSRGFYQNSPGFTTPDAHRPSGLPRRPTFRSPNHRTVDQENGFARHPTPPAFRVERLVPGRL